MATSELNLPKKPLRNQYFVIRHCESETNTRNICVSDPKIGCVEYGLTDTGRRQATDAAQLMEFKLTDVPKDKVLIYSSDFLRAKETAEIIRDFLGLEKSALEMKEALRERGTDKWNMKYKTKEMVEELRERDMEKPTHNDEDMESVMQVAQRMSKLVQEVEMEFENHVILLCSHRYPCQILQSVFNGLSPEQFWDLPRLEIGNILELNANYHA